MKWHLDEALDLIRILQPLSRKFDYHLCLGGGVLNKGESDKDLDLYFLPLTDNPGKKDKLIAYLDTLWSPNEVLGGDYPEDQRSGVYKAKLKYVYSGKYRIDVFILG